MTHSTRRRNSELGATCNTTTRCYVIPCNFNQILFHLHILLYFAMHFITQLAIQHSIPAPTESDVTELASLIESDVTELTGFIESDVTEFACFRAKANLKVDRCSSRSQKRENMVFYGKRNNFQRHIFF